MREDCKFFESRSYASGDTVRKCDLDLAPEAPWRCPENCEAYQPRTAAVNWKYGSLVTPPTPAEPASLGEDESIGALLDEAEEIVRNAGRDALGDLDGARSKKKKKRRKDRTSGVRNKFGSVGQYLRDQRKKGK